MKRTKILGFLLFVLCVGFVPAKSAEGREIKKWLVAVSLPAEGDRRGLEDLALPADVSLALGTEGKGASAFLTQALTEFPAEHVIFFRAGSETRVPAGPLAATLRRVLKGKRIAVLGSESCYDQQLEVAYEWRGVAEYSFSACSAGSKGGFDFRRLLRWLEAHRAATVEELASALPQLYRESVELPKGSFLAAATVRTVRLHPLRVALEHLAGNAVDWIDDTPAAGRGARAELLRKIATTERRSGASANDLALWLAAMREWAHGDDGDGLRLALERAAQAGEEALQRAVVAKSSTVEGAWGMGIWMPAGAEEFEQRVEEYREGRFYRGEERAATGYWGKWVERMGR